MNTIQKTMTLIARNGVQEEEGDRDNRGRATTAIVLDQIEL